MCGLKLFYCGKLKLITYKYRRAWDTSINIYDWTWNTTSSDAAWIWTCSCIIWTISAKYTHGGICIHLESITTSFGLSRYTSPQTWMCFTCYIKLHSILWKYHFNVVICSISFFNDKQMNTYTSKGSSTWDSPYFLATRVKSNRNILNTVKSIVNQCADRIYMLENVIEFKKIKFPRSTEKTFTTGKTKNPHTIKAKTFVARGFFTFLKLKNAFSSYKN